MADARSRWWTRRDTQRLISRAEATSGGVISAEELTYMRACCELLLIEILPLTDLDRARVQQLHHALLAHLAESTVAPNGGGKP
jgi:hypothetical protein